MPKHMSVLGPVFSASGPEAFAADMTQSSQQISDDECAGLGSVIRGLEDQTAFLVIWHTLHKVIETSFACGKYSRTLEMSSAHSKREHYMRQGRSPCL